jgi:hypothetical protein
MREPSINTELTSRSPTAQDDPMADDETMRDRLFQAFDLFEFGVEMMAANLRRKHPEATPERIEELLDQWLAAREVADEGEASEGEGAYLLSP